MADGPRLLLINLHSTHNAGDAALMLAAIEQLQAALPGAQVTLLMNDPASYPGRLPVVGSLFTLVKRSRAGRERWRWLSLVWLPWLAVVVRLARRRPAALGWLPRAWQPTARAFAQADLVVSCPGGFLFSAGLSLPLAISVLTMALAPWAGRPLYVLPQSIGPLRAGWERRLVGWLLARARLVMVREAVSRAQLPGRLAPERVLLIPDLALTFAAAPLAAAANWLAQVGLDDTRPRPWLGVTVINWRAQNPRFPSQADYEQAVAQAVRQFVRAQGGTVVFFAQVCGPSLDQDDRVAARRVAAQLADLGDALCLINHTPEPAVLKAAMGQMDVFVGTRMHSNLFAFSGAVPLVAIAYQPKTQGIMRMLGLERWVLPIEQAQGAALADKLAALWADRHAVRAQLAAGLPALISQAAQAGRLVAEDYQQWQAPA
ncbi:MAG: polysaccharide pyruvyl transferase family protein [Anaerolineales bacterium]|nr:polysaccharide pyruvyl transferase family protein [Anaerolineales bacterium]